MAKFKVVTPAGANYGAPGGDYRYENEALEPLGAEIVEVNAASENEFISAAHDADALYSRGGRLTRRRSAQVEHLSAAQMRENLALHPLQGVVHGLRRAVHPPGDLLVGAPLQVHGEDAALKVGQ